MDCQSILKINEEVEISRVSVFAQSFEDFRTERANLSAGTKLSVKRREIRFLQCLTLSFLLA